MFGCEEVYTKKCNRCKEYRFSDQYYTKGTICKICILEKAKERYGNNKEAVKQKVKEYNLVHREDKKQYLKEYFQNNKEKLLKKHKEYKVANKEKINHKIRERDNKRRRIDHGFRLKKNISRSMNKSLHGCKCNRSWQDLVGYTKEELKNHLENLFTTGMTWENYGKFGWEVDHIRPVTSFDITSYNCQDFKDCWKLENLQPLWREDNIKKSSKWNPEKLH